MKSHRSNIIPIVALAIAIAAFAPASASASSILSGYGGPGQGAQAILGSQLLNGPSGGAGGGSGGQTGYAQAAGTPSGSGASSTGGGASSLPRHPGGATPSHSAIVPSQAQSRGVTHVTTPAQPASANGPLGLSNAAFLIALLAVAALVFTGLLTRGLAKASGTRWHAGS